MNNEEQIIPGHTQKLIENTDLYSRAPALQLELLAIKCIYISLMKHNYDYN